MTEQERIALLVRTCGNGRKFAEKVGTTSGSVSKLLSGKFHIDAFAVRIANAFPEVNCRWLLTGEGEPFAKEAENSEIKAELRALREAVEELAGKGRKGAK